MWVESCEDVLSQRARRLVALNERLASTVVRSESGVADLLGELVYFTLRNRSARLNADAAFRALRQRFPTWHQLAEAPRSEIEEAIHPAGLVHQRAELIQKLVASVESDFPSGSCEVIRTWADPAVLSYLISLPGIGQFAADQAMLYILGRPVLPVSSPLTRLLTRLGIVDQTVTTEAVASRTASVLAPGEHPALYGNLLEHARSVCTRRTPRCHRCKLNDMCAYNQRVRQRRGLAVLESVAKLTNA